jgi:hypothetical protein
MLCYVSEMGAVLQIVTASGPVNRIADGGVTRILIRMEFAYLLLMEYSG